MSDTYSYNTVYVQQSNLDSVKSGNYYSIINKGKTTFIFDNFGARKLFKPENIRYQILDPVVMLVFIKSSMVDSVNANKVYRVFDDISEDERYILDNNGEKVIFDQTVFLYELL